MTSVETKENENRKERMKNKTKTDKQKQTTTSNETNKTKTKIQKQTKGGQTRPLFSGFLTYGFLELFRVQSNEISSLQSSVWMATLFDEKYLISTITVRIAPVFVSDILNKLIEHTV